MIGADILASRLAAAGCKRAFGIPGGEVLAAIDAFERVGIRFILTKHENPAGFMAEGSWHADGSLPVMIATLGPGVANAVNVIANAMQDRVPLIVVTGCVGVAEAESFTHQVFDHQALLRPIVKASFRAEHGTIGLVAEKALAVALDGQPGPVHIDLPVAVAEALTREDISLKLGVMVAPQPITPALEGPLANAVAALKDAKRPLAIAGVDAVNEAAGAAITDFCKSLNLPLLTTYKGKGLINEADPLALGGVGLSPRADRLVLPLVAGADCVLLIGYDPIEMRAGWSAPFSTTQCVVEITATLRTHGMHRVDHTIRGSIVDTLGVLKSKLDPFIDWADGAPAITRAALRTAFAPGPGFGPAAVFATLRDTLPADTIATADSGAHRILLSQMWTCSAPRTLLQSTALCTMGCAVPLAGGYKLARPEMPVIAFVGDAGLEMIIGELATLRDLQLPIIICVLVDQSLALIEMKQRSAQRKTLGVNFGGTDFPAVARAFGGYGAWIDNVETLRSETAKALTDSRLTVLACKLGPRAYDGLF